MFLVAVSVFPKPGGYLIGEKNHGVSPGCQNTVIIKWLKFVFTPENVMLIGFLLIVVSIEKFL